MDRAQAFTQGRAIGGLGAQTDLVYHSDFVITGTELTGDRKEFGIDPLVLPDEPFDWQVASFYLYNGEGSTGAPSGSWQFQLFTSLDGLGLTWRVAAKIIDLAGRFADNKLLKPQVDYRLLQAWSSSLIDGGIRFGIVCASPPTLGPATLQAGVTGNILFY